MPEPPGPTGPTGPAGPEALPSTPPANGPWPSHAVSLTTPPAAVGTSQSDAEKYWEIEVPDFDRATVTQPGSHGTTKDQPLSSYLRLGTAESFSGSESADYQRRRGKDLADKVQGFVDDERYRGEQGSDTYGTWTKEQRKAESALLHTKGGWRDHSDGNRVSTTRGDKVEVIRGDYKLVVLGRELGDHEDYAGAEYEMAGGMILDGDEAPGSVTKISWNKEGDTWRVIEETTKGDVISRYHGDVVEEFYGDTVTSITGAPVPGGSIAVTPKPADDAPEAEWAAWHAVNDESGSHPDGREAIAHGGKWDNHDITKNPAILEKTWAKSIESYTGSETSRIPTIKERVWAVDIDEEVHSENLRSVTRVKTMRDEVTAVGVNQMLLVGGGLADTTIATTAVETIIHGVFVEIELTGAALELSLYGAKTEIEIGGPKLDIHLGPVFEIEIPDAKDLTMSSTELSLEQKVAALQTKTATLERTTCSINTRIAGMVSVGSP